MPNTIKSENWDGVTAPALPTGWSSNFANSGLVTDSLVSFSAPNSLLYTPGGSNATQVLIWQTADSSNGSVQVSALFESDSNPSQQANMFLVARWQPAQTTIASSSTAYFAEIILNGGGNTGCSIISQVSGSGSFVAGPSFPSAFTGGIWYYMQLICQGTSIQLRIQRQDNDQWLNASGIWVTDATGQTFVFTITDSTITGAGYAGVGFFSPGSNGTLQRTDNFLFENLGGPFLAGSTYVAPSSATALIVSGSRAQGGSAPYNYQYQRSTDKISWTDVGSAQTGLDANTDPSPVTDTGLTTGTIYYYQTVQTDSGTGSANTPLTSMAPRAAATTYYLAAGGSDSNNGTSPATPWQTIAQASNWGAMPGDTFLLNGGDTFSGSLTFMNVAGTYASPTNVNSYGTGRGIISCGDSYGIRFAKCSGMILRNMVVEGSGVSSGGVTTSTFDAVDIVNPNLSGALTQIWVDNVDVSGCYSGIEVWGVALTPTINGSGFKDVRITNCTAHEIAYTGVFVRTLPLLNQDGVAFEWYNYDRPNVLASAADNFNIFKGTPSQYIYVGSCQVHNSYGDPNRDDSVNSGDGIMVKSASDAIIERCLSHDNGANGFGPAGIWFQEVTRGVIRYCEAYNQFTSSPGVDGDGFDMDGGCVNCTIEYCYSHDNWGAGYLCGPYSGANPPSSCTLRYCISERDGSRGLGAIFPYGNANLAIYNCAIYSAAPVSGNTACIKTDSNAVSAYNNIFLTTGGINFLDSGTGNVFVGNLYYTAGTWQLLWNSTSYTTLADWITATGQETLNSIIVGIDSNPNLQDIGGGSAQLPSNQVNNLTAYDQTNTSPTIGIGLDLLTAFNIDVGLIDFHEYPNRYQATATSTGFDIGPTKFNAQNLLPPVSTGIGGAMLAMEFSSSVPRSHVIFVAAPLG